jgi:hypothetical protein
MRIGYNPQKDKPLESSYYSHQVIIPVFIPNFEGYYKDSFIILKHCLNSLFQSIHSQTMVTIVNNGSCKEIVHYLNRLFDENKIQEIIHTENLGKLNSIIKGLSGNNIELVTIADSDVLFLKNWQKETVSVFNNFPKAGVVGIVPQIRMFTYLCDNVIFDNLFSKNLNFTELKNPNAFKKFYKSLGWVEDYNTDYLRWILSIERNNAKALVGSGHFVATYKKVIFKEVKTYFGFKMGAKSEKYLDKKPLSYNLWRLTTEDNYAYHMGNVAEDWMVDEVKKNETKDIEVSILLSHEKHVKINKLTFFIKNVFFCKVFENKIFRSYFYSFKKLPKDVLRNY